MAGRWLAGGGQLLLAVIGFVLVVAWFAVTVRNTYNLMVNDAEPRPAVWLGVAGGLSFLLSWLWAWVSSLQILRAARESEAARVPPRLS